MTGDYLLIDNSNSFTKFALASRRQILGKPRRLSTRTLSSTLIQKALRSWRFSRVILSSVVPEKSALIAGNVRDTEVLHVSAAIHLGVGIDYPRPRTIGADRLANAASAAAIYGPPVVVVDFGTAVSFDVISRGRCYVGGVIAPGLEAMTDYLHQRTALLPKISLLEPPHAIGKSTRQAMLAGAVYGYRGLVRQIIHEVRAEMKEPRARVVATGGYAELIAAGLPEISAVHENLTLEGLRIIGLLNE